MSAPSTSKGQSRYTQGSVSGPTHGPSDGQMRIKTSTRKGSDALDEVCISIFLFTVFVY